MLYLITTPTCPNCPTAKQLIAEKNIAVTLIDAGTEDGLNFAIKHGINSVPSIVSVEGDSVRIYRGIGEVISWLNSQ